MFFVGKGSEEIETLFTFSGLYLVSGRELEVRGQTLTAGISRKSVQSRLGHPSSVCQMPIYGPQFSEEEYLYPNQFGIPSIAVIVLYRGDTAEKFTLYRVYRTAELLISQLFR